MKSEHSPSPKKYPQSQQKQEVELYQTKINKLLNDPQLVKKAATIIEFMLSVKNKPNKI